MGLVMKRNFIVGCCWLAIGHCLGCSGIPSNENKLGDTTEIKSKQVLKSVVNKFEWQPLVYDSTKQYIYLSFDDGPQSGSMICYNLCRQENIKATFFMVGLHTARKSDGKRIVNTIRESYPQILLANHSYTHANDRYVYFYQHPEMAASDFFQSQDSLHIPFKIARLPGNSAWSRENEIKSSHLVRPVTQLLDSAGYNVIGWDIEWNFNHKNARPVQSPEKLIAQIDSAFAHNRTHVKNQLVILTHDRMFQRGEDADALSKFIQLLKQHPNFVLETIDHYPGLKKITALH